MAPATAVRAPWATWFQRRNEGHSGEAAADGDDGGHRPAGAGRREHAERAGGRGPADEDQPGRMATAGWRRRATWGQLDRHQRPLRPRPSRAAGVGPAAFCGLVSPVARRGHERSTDGLDAVEHGLGVHAEEDDEGEQRCHHEALAPAQVGHRGVGLVGLAVEDPLVGPQQVDGGEDDAGGGHHRPPAAGEERADEDEELADEAVEPGQADRRQHHDGEHAGQDRRHLLQAAELGDLAGVAALVDHADEEEQGAGGQAVVDHLEHAALEALGGEGERAEHDEAQVGHRRVGDEPLQVASASAATMAP